MKITFLSETIRQIVQIADGAAQTFDHLQGKFDQVRTTQRALRQGRRDLHQGGEPVRRLERGGIFGVRQQVPDGAPRRTRRTVQQVREFPRARVRRLERKRSRHPG